MKAINGPGTFIAQAITWSLRSSRSSQSVWIEVYCHLTHEVSVMDGQQRKLPEPMEAYGNIFVYGKDGSINDRGTMTLLEVFAWTEEQIEAMSPGDNYTAPPCRVTVGPDSQGGGFRIDWFNKLDGSRINPPMPDEDREELAGRLGKGLVERARLLKRGKAPKQAPPPEEPFDPNSIPF